MSQGPSLYYRCTLMFITGRRCIEENWVDFQYEVYRMRHRRAHLTLTAWHTMIPSQYFLLFISVCFINQCHYNVITLFHSLCKQGYPAAFCWNYTNVRMEPAYMQSRGVPSKNYRHQPCSMHALASTTTIGMCGLSVDRSFSEANPLTKYQQLRLQKNTSSLYWQFSREARSAYRSLRESWIWRSPDSRTISFGRTVGL